VSLILARAAQLRVQATRPRLEVSGAKYAIFVVIKSFKPGGQLAPLLFALSGAGSLFDMKIE